MRDDHFKELLEAAESMVAYEHGHGPDPPRVTTWLGKVRYEVKEHGETVWSLAEAVNRLPDVIAAAGIASYRDLVRTMIKTLDQTDEGFAQLLGVPVGTVRGWKAGRREPQGAAQTLLRVFSTHPEVVYAQHVRQQTAN